MAPISAAAVIVRKCPRWKDLPDHEDELPAFLHATSAARTNKFPVIPVAIADKECMEHGATTIASVGKLPLARGDPMSSKA